MADPNRWPNFSQFWLPGLLFILSVVSILVTLRNDELPTMGPSERSILGASDLDALRRQFGQGLQGISSWQTLCENPSEVLKSLHFAHFAIQGKPDRWYELRRSLPQREQDALLRCQQPGNTNLSPLRACLTLSPTDPRPKGQTDTGMHLLELTLEIRGVTHKKVFSCAEALAVGGEDPLELAAWYTYYWTGQKRKKPLHFERLTGGTRIFPRVAQKSERSAANSQPTP